MTADPKRAPALSKDEARGTPEERGRFRAFVLLRDQACVSCGRTEAEALEETGYGLEAHHVVRQAVLRDLGLREWLWEPRLGIALCIDPCHRRQTSRRRRVPLEEIPEVVRRFCAHHDLGAQLRTEHPPEKEMTP